VFALAIALTGAVWDTARAAASHASDTPFQQKNVEAVLIQRGTQSRFVPKMGQNRFEQNGFAHSTPV
jgi:hypothetical protein